MTPNRGLVRLRAEIILDVSTSRCNSQQFAFLFFIFYFYFLFRGTSGSKNLVKLYIRSLQSQTPTNRAEFQGGDDWSIELQFHDQRTHLANPNAI